MSDKEKTLYQTLVDLHIPVENHESDLYFPANLETVAILDRFPNMKSITTTFIHQGNGRLYYDAPFAYIPWWESRQSRNVGR